MIAIDKIKVQAGFNARMDAAVDVEGLTSSIKAAGIITPLLIASGGNGKVDLIAGERRLHAAKAAGLKEVPVEEFEGNATAAMAIENMARKQLNPFEEAVAIEKLEKAGYSEDGIADLLGWSKRADHAPQENAPDPGEGSEAVGGPDQRVVGGRGADGRHQRGRAWLAELIYDEVVRRAKLPPSSGRGRPLDVRRLAYEPDRFLRDLTDSLPPRAERRRTRSSRIARAAFRRTAGVPKGAEGEGREAPQGQPRRPPVQRPGVDQ